MFNFNLDHNTLLALEIIALVLLAVLVLWRVSRPKRVSPPSDSTEVAYDMRRDGPQLGV